MQVVCTAHFFQLLRMLSSSNDSDDDTTGNDGWMEQLPPPPSIIPPPRLLNGIRVFSPYYGYVEVGMTPSSDGYGNVIVDNVIVISGTTGWLCLKPKELIEFFLSVRQVVTLNSVPGQIYFQDDHGVNFAGTFQIEVNAETIRVEYEEEEGDKNSVVMDLADITHFLTIENLFQTIIHRTSTAIPDTINTIQNLAIECNGDSKALKRMCQYWWHNKNVKLYKSVSRIYTNSFKYKKIYCKVSLY